MDSKHEIFRESSAVILAGGRSLRMGCDKRMLSINGRSMIQHIACQLKKRFSEVIVSANDPERFVFLGLRIVVDREPGLGPLMGIASALAAVRNDRAFVMSCDTPEINFAFIERMLAEAAGYDLPFTHNSGWTFSAISEHKPFAHQLQL